MKKKLKKSRKKKTVRIVHSLSLAQTVRQSAEMIQNIHLTLPSTGEQNEMSRIQEEPKLYKHQELMDEFNDMCIAIKIHMLGVGDEEIRTKHPKFRIEDLDRVHNQIHQILSEDNKPMRKY